MQDAGEIPPLASLGRNDNGSVGMTTARLEWQRLGWNDKLTRSPPEMAAPGNGFNHMGWFRCDEDLDKEDLDNVSNRVKPAAVVVTAVAVEHPMTVRSVA